MIKLRLGLALTCLAALGLPLRAQQPDTVGGSASRVMVTRVELQASLDQINAELASTAYSASLKASKQLEAAAIKQRLSDGDFHNGDQIRVSILAEPGLSGTYTVNSQREITLPSGATISVAGLLRSEIEAYLSTQFKRFVNQPTVTATPYIRVSMFGGVNKPGFYYVPANTLLSDAIMSDSFANGPANNVRWKKSTIRRQDQVIVDGTEFSDAIYRGRTLDQLNVQAGDEINVAVRPASALFWRIVGASSGLAGLVYLAIRIF